jgi:site-specific DNA-methyltransferase (adenine-specific)
VLDPFMGSGTTALAAKRLGRNYTGFELNPAYCDIIEARLAAPEVPVAAAAKKRKGAAKPAPTASQGAST